jgi:hypothetical protein
LAASVRSRRLREAALGDPPRWRVRQDGNLAPRLGVVCAEDDGWAKDAAAKELMEK